MAQAIAQQNSSLLDRLFREHSNWLTRWLRRQPWTVNGAEDIAADVFVSLLTLPNLESVREPRAMMTTIARRIVYDARRRHDLHKTFEAELAALPEALMPSAEERLIMVQTLQAIDAMLSTLSAKARTAFLLSQIDGLAYADIGKDLKVSVSMVRKYVAQGYRAAYIAANG